LRNPASALYFLRQDNVDAINQLSCSRLIIFIWKGVFWIYT